MAKIHVDMILTATDHCLEGLRMAAMCQGNVGLYSFVWESPTSWKPTLQSNSNSVCAKWDGIAEWSETRKVAMDPKIRKLDLREAT